MPSDLRHGRRRTAALLAALAVVGAILVPLGGASAASLSTTCPPGEGGPYCQLVISAPEAAATGTTFTVQVLVTTDGVTVAKSDPCASKASVALDVNPQFEGGSVQTLQATASAGIATFSVVIPYGSANDGLYQLEASPPDAPAPAGCSGYYYGSAYQDLTAVTVPQDQPIAPCPDNTVCTQTVGGTGSAATLIADSGSFTPPPSWAAPTASFLNGCGAPPVDPTGVLDFSYTPDPVLGSSPKTIVFALKASLVTKGIGQFNICWGAPFTFTTASGAPATPQADGLWWGILPACKRNSPGPCLAFAKSNKHNVAFFGVTTPQNEPKGAPI